MNDSAHSADARYNKNRIISQEDHLRLMQLTEQVGRIAEHLELIRPRADGDDSIFRFHEPESAGSDAEQQYVDRFTRKAKPPLPDPRLIRKILRQRQLRGNFFNPDIFGDPAWDILLDLAAARSEHTRVSVTSLCIASGVPPTTALRWIGQMVHAGLLVRVEDERDRRRAFIELSDAAADSMARYFAELGRTASYSI